MEIHHTKHHQSYVDKLNAALEKYPELQSIPIEKLLADLDNVPDDIRTAVRNNGGGVVNHDLFFATMGPNKGRAAGRASWPRPSTRRSAVSISSRRNSQRPAGGVFGSGWAWLSRDKDGKLRIETTSGHDTPLMFDRTPVLVIDVWEHAYYLKHQNRRPGSIADWWNVIDWDKAEQKLRRIKHR